MEICMDIRLYEVAVDGMIKSFPKDFKGMIFFDRKEDSKSVFLVISDLRNAKLLKCFGSDAVTAVECISKAILDDNKGRDTKTLLVPLGNLLKFNNFSAEEITSSLKLSISKIIQHLELYVPERSYSISTKFFLNKETKEQDGVVYINFNDQVDENNVAIFMYILRRMKWNLPLNDMNPRNEKSYCFFKAKRSDNGGKFGQKEKKREIPDEVEESELPGEKYKVPEVKKVYKPRPSVRDEKPAEKISSWADVKDDDEEEKKEPKESRETKRSEEPKDQRDQRDQRDDKRESTNRRTFTRRENK